MRSTAEITSEAPPGRHRGGWWGRGGKDLQKSKVANGSVVLPGVKGTSVQVRRYREIFQAVCTDQGGVDRMSEVRLQLARRFTATSVMAIHRVSCLATPERAIPS